MAASEATRASDHRVGRSRANSALRLAAIAVGVALLAAFLVYVDTTFNGYRKQIVTLVAINAIVAVSLVVTSGFTGVFSLGQIGFMAIGAYVGALINLPPTWKSGIFLPGAPAWLVSIDTTGWPAQLALLVGCLAGGVIGAAVAVVVGIPLMRLSGHYVAVATMGFLIIVHTVAIQWDDITRGARGLTQIPTYTTIWAAYAWALVTVYVALRLRASPFGRAMIASRENLVAGRAIGVDVLRTRLLAFVVGAFFTAVAGSLHGQQIGAVAPTSYYFTTTFAVIIMVVLGGLGSVTGAVIGATVMTLAPEFLREVEDGLSLGPIALGQHFGLANIILAVGFILVMVFRPAGLFGDRELSLRFPDLLRRQR